MIQTEEVKQPKKRKKTIEPITIAEKSDSYQPSKVDEEPKKMNFFARAAAKKEEISEDEGNGSPLRESEEEDEDEEIRKPVVKRRPIEKTWERYEKKAYEQKKERAGCGPGDCRIF